MKTFVFAAVMGLASLSAQAQFGCPDFSARHRENAQRFCQEFGGMRGGHNYVNGCLQEASNVYYLDERLINECRGYGNVNSRMSCFQQVLNRDSSRRALSQEDARRLEMAGVEANMRNMLNSIISNSNQAGFQVDSSLRLNSDSLNLINSSLGLLPTGNLAPVDSNLRDASSRLQQQDMALRNLRGGFDANRNNAARVLELLNCR